MAWQQRKGNVRQDINLKAASELLQSLIDFSWRRGREEEWKCVCGTPNYMSRHACRKCAAVNGQKEVIPKRLPPLVSTQSTTSHGAHPMVRPPAMAPWATPDIRLARAAQLEAAVKAAQASGGCEDEVVKLEAKLKVQKNAAVKAMMNGPNFKSIESTRSFITRQEKRLVGLEEEAAKSLSQQGMPRRA